MESKLRALVEQWRENAVRWRKWSLRRLLSGVYEGRAQAYDKCADSLSALLAQAPAKDCEDIARLQDLAYVSRGFGRTWKEAHADAHAGNVAMTAKIEELQAALLAQAGAPENEKDA